MRYSEALRFFYAKTDKRSYVYSLKIPDISGIGAPWEAVTLCFKTDLSSDGVILGYISIIRAAIPVIIGVAIEDPLIFIYFPSVILVWEPALSSKR